MTASYTDRYVWAVIRSIPEKQRTDIERELRASIADDTEARATAGADTETAEREALLALGDPDRLAASYADRPNLLIGPRYYFDYLRLLKVLYAIVLPIAVAAVAVAQFIGGDGIGQIVGGSVATALSVAVHMGFWTTLIFAILERSAEARKGTLDAFKLESLPELPNPKSGAGLGEFITAVVFLVLFGGALVWQQMSSLFRDAAGQPIPFLQPELWDFWLPYTFVLIGAEIVFAAVLFGRGRWTWPLAFVNVALNVAFTVPVLTLLWRNQLVNPDFLAELSWTNPAPAVVAPILTVAFVAIAIGDSFDGLVKANRARRAGVTA